MAYNIYHDILTSSQIDKSEDLMIIIYDKAKHQNFT